MHGYFCIGFIDFMLRGKKFFRVYKFILSKQIWKEWQNSTKIFLIESKEVKMNCNKYRKFKKN